MGKFGFRISEGNFFIDIYSGWGWVEGKIYGLLWGRDGIVGGRRVGWGGGREEEDHITIRDRVKCHNMNLYLTTTKENRRLLHLHSA